MKIENFIKENKELNIKEYDFQKTGIVYFICEKDGSIIYIGSTTQLQNRITQHFISIKFYNKPVFFFYTPDYKEIERNLIYQIKPKYNTQQVNNNYPPKYSIKTKSSEEMIKTWDIERKEQIKAKKELKKVIAEKKTTRKELAKLMNVSPSRISDLLHNDCCLHRKTVKNLIRALNSL